MTVDQTDELRKQWSVDEQIQESANKMWERWKAGDFKTKKRKYPGRPVAPDEIEQKIAEVTKEAERIKREAQSMGKKMKGRGRVAGIKAQARGLTMPNFDGLEPDQIREAADAYREEADQERNRLQLEGSDAFKQFMKVKHPTSTGLTCPECGAGDDGNLGGSKGNLKPYCIKCNMPLENPHAKKKKMRVKRVTNPNEAALRRLRGLP